MSDLVQLILAVGVVIFTSAMCSVMEAVLYAVPLSHVESLAKSGRASGRILRRLRAHVDKPIAAILSLNTIANTGGAAVAGALAHQLLGDAKLAYFSAAFTFAILLFSEVLPKTVGVVYNRPLSSLIAVPLQILVWIFMPFIWFLRFVTRLISSTNVHDRISDEELLMLVRLGMRSGDLQAHEADVIRNILELESKTAHSIMTPRTVVFSLNTQLTVEEARQHSEVLHYSRIPVYAKDPEDVIGIVHRREIFKAVAENRLDAKLEALMRPVHFVLESMALDQLLRQFLDRRQHLVVVIDEYGGLSGVVSLEDVLEEILGKEIVDEFDKVTDLRELAQKRREKTLRRQQRGPTAAAARRRALQQGRRPEEGSRVEASPPRADESAPD